MQLQLGNTVGVILTYPVNGALLHGMLMDIKTIPKELEECARTKAPRAWAHCCASSSHRGAGSCPRASRLHAVVERFIYAII